MKISQKKMQNDRVEILKRARTVRLAHRASLIVTWVFLGWGTVRNNFV